MRVRIYQPAKNAMQSGRAKYCEWRIDPVLETPRTPEPLMGWLRAGETLGELMGRMSFRTPEEAASFARRNGWDYTIDLPEERRVRPRSYLDNFRIVRPEDEERRYAKKH
ncbi:MAG: ETC complex I subunit [Bdellovibrionales bacterium]